MVSAEHRLASIGFADPAAAKSTLDQLGIDPDVDRDVVDQLAAAADPDLALTGLSRLADATATDRTGRTDRSALMRELRRNDGLRRRLFLVLGASSALADHLARHPGDWQVLRDDAIAASRPSRLGLLGSLAEAVDGLTGRPAYDALRIAYKRRLLTLAARDLSGSVQVDDVAAELADLAEGTLGAALDVARREHPTGSRLAVIGLGKCGGRELNYVSDVDVVFVAEPADAGAAALAAAMMRVCSEVTAEGTIWPVDAALRPEGKSGPL
ncbi:MAG: [glutamine synthetase] adenylyltransferase / [glutamine synthetase]-adenylyl-L-tyrosine, partial [Frankiaceae bacterium]|nr:[glutamine synthetase] adenylyltransferase / [glutamine synthetase]-adenylyl-L-tyrosine [Frankiaceae bacterium]